MYAASTPGTLTFFSVACTKRSSTLVSRNRTYRRSRTLRHRKMRSGMKPFWLECRIFEMMRLSAFVSEIGRVWSISRE